ncbi:MAG: nitrous oxide-stimulated promoter family protein [Bacteroidetes bacterium]|nr:nitrous oxide-stimulated promoter family protein [Bacteroidota bacterium]
MSVSVEKQTIKAMVEIFCKDHHQDSASLCSECSSLLEYAFKRIEYCQFKDKKPACNNCTVHCYSESKREKVKEIMRYAGPKMALRHPYLSLLHLLKRKPKTTK